MPASLPTALRACIALAGSLTLVVQVVLVPSVAIGEADAWPQLAPVCWSYGAFSVLVVACVQLALLAIWRLLAKVERDEVFTDAAFAWVDVIIAAAVTATLLAAGLAAHLLLVERVGGPAVVLALGAVLVAGSTFSLLMAVMRGLLRSATSMRGELAEVV